MSKKYPSITSNYYFQLFSVFLLDFQFSNFTRSRSSKDAFRKAEVTAAASWSQTFPFLHSLLSHVSSVSSYIVSWSWDVMSHIMFLFFSVFHHKFVLYCVSLCFSFFIASLYVLIFSQSCSVGSCCACAASVCRSSARTRSWLREFCGFVDRV